MCPRGPSPESAEITFPSADKLWLIAFPSFSRSAVAFVLLARSDPARSTNDSFPIVRWPVCLLVDSISSAKTKWDREEVAFMSVLPVFLAASP